MTLKPVSSRKEMSQGLLAVFFSAPAVLIIAATILVPFGMAVFLSLHNWNLERPGRERFIGWDVSPHTGGGSLEGGTALP